jgi:tellurite resistance protein
MAHAFVRRAVDDLLAHATQPDRALQLVVDLGTLVAVSDGVIDDAEHEALTDLLDAAVGAHVAPVLVRAFVAEAREAVRRDGRVPTAERVGRALRELGVVTEGLAVAIHVARASEGVCAQEREVLDAIARASGAPTGTVSALVSSLGGAPTP